jgi:hypothetical protein
MFPPYANPYPTAAQVDATVTRAAALVTLPDNWKLATESQATGWSAPPGIVSATLDSDADLSAVSEDTNGNGALDPGEDRNANGVIDLLPGTRVVIFDIDGTHSEVRTICTNPTPGTIAWPEPLPARFDVSPSTGAVGNIGRVRIENSDRVYTWMLTVRKRGSGTTTVDVVVFYKRQFNFEYEERLIDAEFRMWNLGPDGVPGTPGDDNGVNGANDPGEIGFPGSDDFPNNTVVLKIPSTLGDEERPKPRRGGYLFDTKNGLWYRITAVSSVVTVGPNDEVTVTLDQFIKQNGTEDVMNLGTLDAGEDANGDTAITRGFAIYHPAVCNVFPLETKEP